MYRMTVRVRFAVQVVVLHIAWALARLRPRRSGDAEWLVGPYEVAALVHRIATALPGARSVLLAPHPFYTFPYDYAPSRRAFPGLDTLRAWFLGPYRLGTLAAHARGVIYVGGEGFLNVAHDQREFEFRFLSKRGVRIVCYFTGNDIRSPRLMRELEAETGRPNIATYLGVVNPVFTSPGYDDAKRRLAESANRYADAVFNAAIDQLSYLAPGAHPFLYFHPDDEIVESLDKFDDVARPVVLHAPSSPALKGTQLVRAAVARLRREGYDFEYVELSGVSHDRVREALERAHIVLNEFYSYVPGVFGVEGLAAGCAVVTSADERLDPELPKGSNEAWVPTEHFAVVDSLRALLDEPDRARALAERGRQWVLDNASFTASRARLTAVLDALG